MITYLLLALIMSATASLILKRMNLSWAWCIIAGIICLASIIWCGVLFVKEMDSPPPGSTEVTQEELNRAAGIE